ncbi:MAG: sulfite exporter TauE/SafE family protein [Bacteroidota bacterium]
MGPILLLFILLSLVAEILGTIGGFGSSMFFVPIAGYFFDFHSVLGITALFHLSSNFSKIALFRNGFDKKLVITIGIPAVIFVIIGGFLSQFFDSKLLEVSLAVFLIVLSGLLLLFRQFSLKPTISNSIIGGSVSGVAAGLLGTGGAVRGLTLAAFKLDKERFIATSAIIDMAIDLSRSVVYFSNGYMHRHDLYLVPILLVVAITGTLIGKKVLTRFSESKFRNLVLYLILFVGILTLLKMIWH